MSSEEDVEVDLGAVEGAEEGAPAHSEAAGLDLTLQQLTWPIYAPTLFQAIGDGISIPLIPIMVHQLFESTEGMVGATVAVVGVGKIAANPVPA